ncbi:hypothetical protein Rhopal_002105-T1 [Rhodotorula paludigena]|uniref:Putative peptidase domain-containing protein n=1 Tax=Rhodotorula paludigena TaxID=86838 RepID=A0AAV5G962_9BASI|nr:hypothetical protein Rhopal_002105-T1 [Rhodotorula paludigena]
MLPSLVLASASAAAAVQAMPFFTPAPAQQLVKRDNTAEKSWEGHTDQVKIHDPAQTAFIQNGLNEMRDIAEHAHDRILRLGEYDPLYVKYFGNASSAAASGIYAQIRWGNKAREDGNDVLIRCDDPDGNCALFADTPAPWAGHWRGNNATQETVICDATYTGRSFLSTMCWDGQEIGVGKAAQWFAGDLTDGYPELLALAANNDSSTVYNQATLQWYALDAWAHDKAFPPNGCTGEHAHEAQESHDDSHGGTSSSAAASSTQAAASSTSDAATSIPTAHEVGSHGDSSSAGQDCHSHASGEIHCV